MTEDVKAAYITSPQAARILRITYVGVAQLARQGKIPAVKIANRWLIPKAFVDEFAKTYEGKRGRPRKGGPSTDAQKTWTPTTHPAELGPGDKGAIPEAKELTPEADVTLAMNAQVDHLEEIPAAAIPLGELASGGTGTPSEVKDSKREADMTLAINAQVDHLEDIPAPRTQPSEPGPGDKGAVSETQDFKRETDKSFAVSAEIYHLDSNYDFELYEKGEITEGARLIVARLKPKIPSLPQFSFRWDYRYEHLNVDIHGVEPAVIDWFRLGENGYTGHLPRRLGGPDPTFEATIWLPVTFVFRGRLRLVLQKNLEAEEDLPSTATASEGHRKWGRFIGAKRTR